MSKSKTKNNSSKQFFSNYNTSTHSLKYVAKKLFTTIIFSFTLRHSFSSKLGAGVVIALIPNAMLGELLKFFKEDNQLLESVYQLTLHSVLMQLQHQHPQLEVCC
jgi:hypothetical protein